MQTFFLSKLIKKKIIIIIIENVICLLIAQHESNNLKIVWCIENTNINVQRKFHASTFYGIFSKLRGIAMALI